MVLRELAAREDRIHQVRPAAGPSRMATATARFSSTTGEGFSSWSTS
jgi:hypothetical protein